MAEQDAIELRIVLLMWNELCEHWALEAREEGELLGKAPFSGHIARVADWQASRMEQRMRMLIDLATILDDVLLDVNRIRAWLRCPNDSLGGLSPIAAMSSSTEWIHWVRRAVVVFAA